MSYPVHGGRALLNPPGHQTTAAIVAEIEDTSDWKPGKDRNGEPLKRWNIKPNYTLQISDCDRSIRFTLGWEEAEDRKASLEKVDTLLRILKDFRKGVALEQRRCEQRVLALPTEGDE